MSDWTADELTTVDATDEVHVLPARGDGSLRKPVTIWAVRVDGDVYVRAAYGPGTGWYRHARETGAGRFTVAGVDRAVSYADADPSVASAVDDAYRAKYTARYPKIIQDVVGEKMHGVTLRVLPTD